MLSTPVTLGNTSKPGAAWGTRSGERKPKSNASEKHLSCQLLLLLFTLWKPNKTMTTLHTFSAERCHLQVLDQFPSSSDMTMFSKTHGRPSPRRSGTAFPFFAGLELQPPTPSPGSWLTAVSAELPSYPRNRSAHCPKSPRESPLHYPDLQPLRVPERCLFSFFSCGVS